MDGLSIGGSSVRVGVIVVFLGGRGQAYIVPPLRSHTSYEIQKKNLLKNQIRPVKGVH